MATGAELSRPNSTRSQMEDGAAASKWFDELLKSITLDPEIGSRRAVNVNHENILRVPEHIKQANLKAYKPSLISIGPIHHGHPDLNPMEEFKTRYAKDFLQANAERTLELFGIIDECEAQLRFDYGIGPEVPKEKFVKMMLIDGTFLVEFFVEQYEGKQKETDRTIRKKWSILMSDLLLLENQIPAYYLDRLLGFVEQRIPPHELMDFIIAESPFYLTMYFSRKPKHLLDSLQMKMAYLSYPISAPSMPPASCPTIWGLHQLGVKFRCSKGSEIRFEGKTLKLPKLKIDHNTTKYFASLSLLELYHDGNRYATDYIALMDYLIDGPEDVRILVENKIIMNYLYNDTAAANLINEIGKLVSVRGCFRYSGVVEDLSGHCRHRWNKRKSEWKRDLIQDYFQNPWKILSVIAAVILLGLTFAQTVCSFLQLKQAK